MSYPSKGTMEGNVTFHGVLVRRRFVIASMTVIIPTSMGTLSKMQPREKTEVMVSFLVCREGIHAKFRSFG